MKPGSGNPASPRPPKRKSDSAFLLIAFGLLAVGLWQAYVPYAGRMEDIQAIRESIVPLAPDELTAKLQSVSVPTVLYVYASWCGNCARVTPHLIGIAREHEYDDVRFLFVSVDERETDLLDYLVRRRYDGLFTPYIVRRDSGESLYGKLAEVNVHFTGAIPYLAFFDRQGDMVQEFTGAVDRSAVLAALSRARQ